MGKTYSYGPCRLLLQIVTFIFLASICHGLSTSTSTTNSLPSSTSNASPRQINTKNSTAPTSTTQTSNNDVIQIVESEVWTGERWVGANPRWTTPDGSSSASPAEMISPPKDGEWSTDWKIILGGEERDNFGWSYWYSMPGQKPRRQRIWLRSFQAAQSNAVGAAPIKIIPSPAKLIRIPPLATEWISSAVESLKSIPAGTQQLAQLVRDDWNFKGFGCSFYKSFIFKRSFGAAFRIPLTTNLNLWDRRPELPSLSMTVACYWPPTIMVGISLSCNMEWARWAFVQLGLIIRQLIAIFLLNSARSLVLIASVMAFPLTGQVYHIPDSETLLPPLDSTFRERPNFSTTLQERVGVSYSWRISAKRGYEFRRSIWHLYLPTLLSLVQHAESIQQAIGKTFRTYYSMNRSISRYWSGFVPRRVRLKKQKTGDSQSDLKSSSDKSSSYFFLNPKWAEWWLRRKSGSLGVSTSYPTPDKPHFSCSAVLSLSGFYFKEDTFGGADVTPATPSSTSTVKETIQA